MGRLRLGLDGAVELRLRWVRLVLQKETLFFINFF